MRKRGLGRVRRGLNFIVNQIQGRVAILLYHRVAEHVPDPQLLCVSPGNFMGHLQELRRHYQPISLVQLERSLQAGRLPQKAVVVTFDDGYVDNLWHAKPLLDQYEWPATVFAVSGYVGEDRELISDELERLLLEPATLPKRLKLTIAGQEHAWELGDSGAQLSPWNVATGEYPSLRHRCYYDLHKLVRPLDRLGRQEILETLSGWVGNCSPVRQDRRVMKADELREWAKGGLADVGGHTASHLLLAAQPVEAQRREIVRSKESLEQILGRPVTSFAYPYGGSQDVSEQTVNLVRQTGFEIACANVAALVTPRSDPLWLPRYLVRDWDRQEFTARLKKAFDD